MSERKMCHDCPHKAEHEGGEEICLFPDFPRTPHPCHNAIHLPCVGHQMQQTAMALGIKLPEDYQTERIVFWGLDRKIAHRDVKAGEG